MSDIAEDTTQQTSNLSGGESAASSTEPVQTQSSVHEGTAAPSAAPASSSPAGQQPTGPTPQGQEAVQQQWQSIRQAAYEQYGLDMRNLPDDGAALRHLIGQASQAQQNQAYAQRYAQNAQQFEQYLSQQQQQRAEKPASWWNPPEYNPAWRNQVQRDPQTGEFKLAPGASPDVLPKLLAYEQYRRDFADKLTSDPVATLKPFIEDVARQIAQGQVQQHLGSYQEQVYADNYVQQNSGWLHQRDNQNNVVVDPFTKQPLLSAAGQRFKGYVEQLQNMGVTNIRIQEQQARGFVERDIAMAQLQQIRQGQQNQQQKNQFLAQNNTRQPNQSGVLSPGGNSPPPHNPGLSLKDRLTQKLHEAGVTDADFSG